jgi:hypothetical protein
VPTAAAHLDLIAAGNLTKGKESGSTDSAIVRRGLTTICGLAQLVFIPGAGTELYRGVGAIVLFGLFNRSGVAHLSACTLHISAQASRVRPGTGRFAGGYGAPGR